jgi:sialic acid synthase SpsE
MPTPHVTVIAEVGVNHNGRLNLALALVDAAARPAQTS